MTDWVGVRRKVVSILSQWISVDWILHLEGAAVRTPQFE
ncbi:hypothetical protein CABS01_16739 [Colletotrichum abscissum]|nr:uncharacterized protein CABS01_16739 [Colletotrichum abscissum]KAK1514259.1 hypothetical protein CABS01_16739 [Colletotrichum abscissum]